jgi:hypothetical protein
MQAMGPGAALVLQLSRLLLLMQAMDPGAGLVLQLSRLLLLMQAGRMVVTLLPLQ